MCQNDILHRSQRKLRRGGGAAKVRKEDGQRGREGEEEADTQAGTRERERGGGGGGKEREKLSYSLKTVNVYFSDNNKLCS